MVDEWRMFVKKLLPILLLAVLLLGVLPNVSASTVKDARKHAEDTLLPLEGVAGISHIEKPPTIIVYLEHEKYRGMIPNEIMGYRTTVIVSGRIKALALVEPETIVTPLFTYPKPVSRTGIVRPIVGGVSLGVPETAFGGAMAGTLGVVTDNLYILSCAHVIAMDSNAKFLKKGTPVLQPGTIDGGTGADQVGTLYKYIKITFGGRSIRSPNYADAAIATLTLTTSEYLNLELLGADNQNTYTISGTTTVSVGETVKKSGRTSGVTPGTVSSTFATVKVYYTSTTWAIFTDQILVNQPFGQAGDSGSLVDKDKKFVGLLFAGSDTITVVCKASYILQGLPITVT